jgi:hypothetical protein
VTTSISVPDQQGRTRDLGVAEQHSTARPPFLVALERQIGTEALAEAITQWQDDQDVQARLRGVDPDRELRSLSLLRGYGDPKAEALADEFEAAFRQQPVATPFPATVPAYAA